ncbi:origin recognition complex subunit 4 C-terminus-domain-containing protein [Daedaleopsis nitida]|nr:origin recognition complex subunit 4 C-terminus-domain-containing protein [Daedaleopsis nitida]
MGTPRTILHSVEITTPRHLLKTLKRDLGSPAPRDSAHLPEAGTPRLPAAFPTAISSATTRSLSPNPVPIAPVPDTTPRATRRGAPASPAKGKRAQSKQTPDQLPAVLPDRLHPLLNRQKRSILRSLQRPPEIDEIEVYGEDYPPTYTAAYEQLGELLTGSVVRGEGNSCLLIGPSGSGKTQMVERVIATLPSTPIVVRLSGYAQHNDKLAIREIAWQLAQQTGQSFLPSDPDEADEEGADADGIEPKEAAIPQEGAEAEADDDENPFVESAPTAAAGIAEPIVALPPPAHLLALISMIPTLPRPTVVVIDGFDLFAGHARQALLYCLLDTAQSCRAGTNSETGSGMAVVGVTARVDTINLLEKRVKSRFSGRMIRTACPTKLAHWVELAKASLGASIADEPARADEHDEESADEWARTWAKAVERFVGDEEVVETLRETYALTRDFQMFRRIMTSLALDLSATSPYPTQAKLESAVDRQRCPPRYPSLHTLPYPAVCLLIASVHAQTSGHDVFTFEMLHDAFKSQVRASQSAPVQIEGGGIGMAFERLVDLHVFRPAAAAAAAGIAREFALHRSTVDRFAVRKAVETIGQLSLKKWLTKA